MERNSKLELLFTDGSTQSFDTKNHDKEQSFDIDSVITDKIRI